MPERRAIDMRVRPPAPGFETLALYWDKPRIIGMGRDIGFEPAPSYIEHSLVQCLAEMAAAGIAGWQETSSAIAVLLTRPSRWPAIRPVMTPSTRGFLAIIRASHDPAGAPRLAAHRTTAIAPMISSRLRSRCPILEICPSRALPPEEFCRGVRPSQAAKSRPRQKSRAVVPAPPALSRRSGRHRECS